MEENVVRNRYEEIMMEIKNKMHISDKIKLFFRYRKTINGRISFFPYKRMILKGDIIDDKLFTGIIAHELGHVKLKHFNKNLCTVSIYIVMCIIFYLLTILNINPIIKLLAITFFFFLIIFGLLLIVKKGKKQEFEADAIAAKYVGFDILCYAISCINKKSITHPSPNERIIALKKSKNKKLLY